MKLEGPQIAVRPYTHNDHYWQAYFATNEAIVRVCQEAGWPAPALLIGSIRPGGLSGVP